MNIAKTVTVVIVGSFAATVLVFCADEIILGLLGMSAGMPYARPSIWHWLGCDAVGRDIFVRLVIGAAVSVFVSASSAVIAATMGAAVGIIAASLAGWWRALAISAIDAWLAFPKMVIAIVAVVIVGDGIGGLIAAITLALFPSFAHLARTTTTSMYAEGFCFASSALGGSRLYIAGRHAPGAVGAIVAAKAAASIGMAVAMEGSLSFLGIGVRDPWPSLGVLLQEGLPTVKSAPAMATGAVVVSMLLVWIVSVAAARWSAALEYRGRSRK